VQVSPALPVLLAAVALLASPPVLATVLTAAACRELCH
jgi:hypothetical protein